MESVRYGIIGVGIQGMTYARMLSGIPPYPGMSAVRPNDCHLAALSSRSPEKESVCKQQFPSVPFYRDWREMVYSGNVDAVIITTPHFQHPEMAIYCMEHGVHVLVEKPAGVFAKAVRRMNQCAQNHPEVSFGMMFNQRTNPVYRQVKQLISSGEMGQIRRSNIISSAWWRPDSYYAQSPWRGTWGGEGGGILLNQAVHQLDLWIWLCGVPEKVHSHCRYGAARNISVENDVTAITEYPDGSVGCFSTCSHDPIGTTRFEIDLDKGKIIIEDGCKATVYRLNMPESEMNNTLSMMDVYQRSAKGELYNVQVIEHKAPVNQHLLIIENFAQHILNGIPLIAPGEEGVHSVELVNAILLSDWLRRETILPVDEDLYLQMLMDKISAEGKLSDITFA